MANASTKAPVLLPGLGMPNQDQDLCDLKGDAAGTETHDQVQQQVQRDGRMLPTGALKLAPR